MNICRKNDKETTELCRLVNDRYYKKALEENPLEENQLWATMIEGCDYIVSLNRNLFLKFANELVGLPCKNFLLVYSYRKPVYFNRWTYN